jgi:hypothetical protein
VVDVGSVRVFDQGGTPQYLVENGIEPIREIV